MTSSDTVSTGVFRVCSALLLVMGMLFLTACSSQPSQPLSKTGGGLSRGKIPPPIAIIALQGVPTDRAGALADVLAEEAGKRDIAIVQGNFSDGYQLAGAFQAVNEGGGVRLLYQWTLTGNTGGVLHQIQGQELVQSSSANPWGGVTSEAMRRIASVTAENLATRLAELGFAVRQAGVLPPSHAFAEAGPNAEKEIDLETYYGSGSPLATASITPNELYTLTPEQLNQRLADAALRQAEERLRAAGVRTQADLMAENDGQGQLAPDTTNEVVADGKSDGLQSEEDQTQLATAQPAPDPQAELAEDSQSNQPVGNGSEINSVAVVGVTGSPGRGNTELIKALRKVLSGAGWPVVNSPGKTTLAISGRVDLNSPANGVQKVKLAWAVMLPTGKVLGTVLQANDVPAGSLDRGWGRTANFAAEAAAEGIFNLVEQMRGS